MLIGFVIGLAIGALGGWTCRWEFDRAYTRTAADLGVLTPKKIADALAPWWP